MRETGRDRRYAQAGISFIELMVVAGILVVLASAALRVAHWDEKRRREAHLRGALSAMREAIDQYNSYVVSGLVLLEDVEQCALPADRSTCFPKTLEELVEGVEVGDPENSRTLKFLKRIPVDPFTEEADWGVRSYQDDWDSDSWGGENVYDVYSLSDRQALDGTYYRDW
jgi:general secretion pathway protein G